MNRNAQNGLIVAGFASAAGAVLVTGALTVGSWMGEKMCELRFPDSKTCGVEEEFKVKDPFDRPATSDEVMRYLEGRQHSFAGEEKIKPEAPVAPRP